MSKAQVKVLERLAGFWSLYVGNLPDYILQTNSRGPLPLSLQGQTHAKYSGLQ